MKFNLQFEENQQNINVHFSEDEEQINANLGEVSVINIGQDGATFIPSVSDDGIISWTNDRALPNPKPVNIKGEKGDSGVSSWNDLEDKPFGDTSPTIDIHWDGVIGDRFAFDMSLLGYGNNYAVKVSDIVPTREEFDGATFTFSDDAVIPVDNSMIDDSTFPGALIIDMIIVVYDNTTLNAALGTPEGYITNGIYFILVNYEDGPYYIKHFITLHGIKTIEQKYLPDSVALKTDIPEVPTKVSELENDAGFITKNDIPESNGVTSWNDLTDKPFGDKLDFSKEVYNSMGKFVFKDASDGTYFAQSSGIIVNLISGEKYQLTVSYMGTLTYAVVEGEAHYDTLLKRFYLIGEGGSFQYDGNVMSITVKSDVPNIANPTFAPLMFVIIKEGNDVTIPLDEKYLPDSVVLESELDAKGYQTEEQVTELINNALGGIENGTY